MDLIKKGGVPFWIDAAGCLSALVGTILYIVTNASAGYGLEGGAMGIAFGILAVLLIAGGAYMSLTKGGQHFIPVLLKFAALVLVCVMFATVVVSRAQLASALFTWDSRNAVGWSVFYTSVAGMVFLLLTVAVLIVGAFLGKKKADA